MQIESPSYEALRSAIDGMRIIETHEHHVALAFDPPDDIMEFLANFPYYMSDMISATGLMRDIVNLPVSAESKSSNQSLSDYMRRGDFPLTLLNPHDVCLDEFLVCRDIPQEIRYAAWDIAIQRCKHTSYTQQAVFQALKLCWNHDDYSFEGLKALESRMQAERTQDFVDKLHEMFKIETLIVNDTVGTERIIRGIEPYNAKLCKLVFSLPIFHDLNSLDDILFLTGDKGMRSLDDYLEAVEARLQEAVNFGIVALKDQTAYRREIFYTNPPKAHAEEIFNKMVSNPRSIFGSQEVRCLDDYLFHRFMRMAAKYELPVQIHTGHLATARNEITKTNPALFTSVLELHRDVKFDLFHGGWPYMGEFLFLGKNYPNVYLDLCWVHCIDPQYSIDLIRRAVMTVPHKKLMGGGGDSIGIESAMAFSVQSRENIAIALSSLVDDRYLTMEDAVAIAEDMLYNNPKELFKL